MARGLRWAGDAAPMLATTEKTLREIMTTEVVTLSVDDSLRLADDIMALANLRHFPVLESERVIGVVSWVDLMRASVALAACRGAKSLREAIAGVSIKEVTMSPATTVSPDTPIREAARLLVENQIESLIVVEGSDLVGLATRTDLLREMARRPHQRATQIRNSRRAARRSKEAAGLGD